LSLAYHDEITTKINLKFSISTNNDMIFTVIKFLLRIINSLLLINTMEKNDMKEDRDIEKTYSLSEFITKLRRLADALETGNPFIIQVDGEKIAVPKDAIASIEHEREDGHEELEFQLSWEIGQKEEDDKEEDEDDDGVGDTSEESERAGA
jgi:amphi-Trp domain-containing protein